MNEKPSTLDSNSRRNFVKKAAYLAPAILTMQAGSAYAKSGSAKGGDSDDGRKPPRPPRGRRD
jgi:hypothetical protein